MSDLASRLAQTQQQLELKKIREEEEIVLPTTFYSPEEKAMALYINDMLKDDKDVQHLLPIYKATPNMLVALKSGLLICKLINLAKQGTIDDRVLNTRADLSEAEIIQNYNLCLNSAPAIGCKVFHIQIEDLLEDKPTAFLDLAWEVIKVGLLSKVSIQKHPEIIRLFDNSQLEELQTVPGEQILLRWINYHLSGGKVSAEPITPRGSERGVKNFGRDLANVEAYVGLMCKLDAEKYNFSMLQEPDTHKRAEQLVDVLKTQFRPWVTPKDINMGNERLNLAMMATIFDVVTGLEPIKEAEALVVKAALEIKDVEGSREERAFCTWINSLGIDRFVNNLHEDVSDGLVLLQMFDKISPGVVDWSRVNQRPTNRFMKNENCNMCVTLGKKLGFVLVGIEGKDFVDKNRKLILALVWQACKYHLLHILKTIGNTNYVDETTIKNWANQTIRAANKKSKEIDNFKDETISTGEFLIDLLDSCEPGVVNYELVTAGSNADEKALNAKYIISIARKIGCFIFLVWEDIVEVKANMILTFLASLMKFNQDRARRTK
jgi:plastin-1